MDKYTAAMTACGGDKVAAAASLNMTKRSLNKGLQLARLRASAATGVTLPAEPRRSTIFEVFDAQHPAKGARHPSNWFASGNVVTHNDSRLLEMEKLPETVLSFSCTQAPYQHPDTIPFLSTVIAQYAPSFTVCHGDEADLKFLKKAFMDADSISPNEELSRTLSFLGDLFRVVPRAICLTSNHVAGRYAAGQKDANFPTSMLKPWPELIGAPDGWQWRDFLIMRDWLFEHGHSIAKGARASVTEDTTKRFNRPLSVMRGHFHNEFGEHIKPLWLNSARQLRMCYTGCLMDRQQVNYTRAAVMLGCIVLVRGVPHPIPLVTDKSGRWVGRLAEW